MEDEDEDEDEKLAGWDDSQQKDGEVSLGREEEGEEGEGGEGEAGREGNKKQ